MCLRVCMYVCMYVPQVEAFDTHLFSTCLSTSSNLDTHAFALQTVPPEEVSSVQYLVSTRKSLLRVTKALFRRVSLSVSDWKLLEDALSALLFSIVSSESRDPLACLDGICDK